MGVLFFICIEMLYIFQSYLNCFERALPDQSFQWFIFAYDTFLLIISVRISLLSHSR